MTFFRASVRSQKKSQVSWDFQRQIHGKIGQFCGNFMELLGLTSPKKIGKKWQNILAKFHKKSIDFALI